ncbi:GDSL esterase/lipase At2g04570-like [Papaver somniferum]|uniref:GDSL esterase/lipase At2g04570-like n=1 Tax=Papaver somniferum TaxID=3469 RepID=UPI000E6F7A2F|nr:GDSL esterase/lipase At2g04570-like [Papaver somniferum]
MIIQYSLLLCVLNILVFSVLQIMGTTKIPGIVVFGDSTVDAGNNNHIPTLAKSNFLPYGQDFEGGKPTGRFCNGRLPTDFLSELLGIKHSVPAYLDPAFGIEDFATGVTFASAATGYDVATSNVLSVIPLSEQLEYFKEYQKRLTSFLGKDRAVKAARESLYFISIGTNDFIENYFTLPGRSSDFTVDEYENFLLGIARNFLTELYSLGARKLALAGLPPSGYLPIAKTVNHVSGRPNLEELNKAGKEFNVKLQNLLASLSKELNGIKLVYADIYNPLLHIIQNPDRYGFENVEEGCCGTGKIELGILCESACTDPSKYAFWDAVHPSEKVYGIVANILMNKTVPQLFK